MIPTDTETSSLMQFYEQYNLMYGYIASIISVFGIISSALSIIVLSRKKLMSPTNCILTALAVADFLLMTLYLIYVIYAYICRRPNMFGNHTIEWTYFIGCCYVFGLTSHNLSIWLTLSLAAFQYISVRHPLAAIKCCSMKRAKITIAISVVGSMALTKPCLFLYQFVPIRDYNVTKNWTGYWFAVSDFASANSQYRDAMFWIFGVFMKIVPNVLLIVLSCAIVHAVRQANRRRQDFLGVQFSRQNGCYRTNQMTYMLVAIMALFIVTHLPDGVMILISGLDEEFYLRVYSKYVDIMVLLLLLKCALTFVIYCTMSKEFRKTFCRLFLNSLNCLNRCHADDKRTG